MNDKVKHDLVILQLKGLRNILGMKATFLYRAQDTQRIYQQVQQHIHNGTDINKVERQFKPVSQVYEERDTQLLNSIIIAPEGSPTKAATFQPNTLHPVTVHNTQGRKRRPGQPRVKMGGNNNRRPLAPSQEATTRVEIH